MAVLHPQEVYLLELYSSLNYIADGRDAWRKLVRHHEECLERFMNNLPPDYRSRHLSEQPDVIWGNTVLPNFRSTLDRLNQAVILLSHNDPRGYNAAGGVQGDLRGANEYWHEWMSEDELKTDDDLTTNASHLNRMIDFTTEGTWQAGTLSWRYSERAWGPLNLPASLPVYTLDPTVIINPGDLVEVCGVYLPEAENTAAQFLHPGRTTWANGKPRPLTVRQGLNKNEYGGWEEEQDIETRWTLIKRIPDQFIEVPPEGFYPKDGISTGRVEANQPCPQSGWWWTPARNDSRQFFKQNDVMPDFAHSNYGATIWYRDANQR